MVVERGCWTGDGDGIELRGRRKAEGFGGWVLGWLFVLAEGGGGRWNQFRLTEALSFEVLGKVCGERRRMEEIVWWQIRVWRLDRGGGRAIVGWQ